MEIEIDRSAETMTSRCASQPGQSVVEAVLVLPMLLILLGGGYWFYRGLSLSSSSESATHAHMLRAGRRLPGIAPRLSGTIHPEDNIVQLRDHNDPLIGEVPFFRGLAGRTIAESSVSLEMEPVGAFLPPSSHAIRRKAEGAVDCWGKDTPSGSTAGRTIHGIVLTGMFR